MHLKTGPAESETLPAVPLHAKRNLPAGQVPFCASFRVYFTVTVMVALFPLPSAAATVILAVPVFLPAITSTRV